MNQYKRIFADLLTLVGIILLMFSFVGAIYIGGVRVGGVWLGVVAVLFILLGSFIGKK